MLKDSSNVKYFSGGWTQTRKNSIKTFQWLNNILFEVSP